MALSSSSSSASERATLAWSGRLTDRLGAEGDGARLMEQVTAQRPDLVRISEVGVDMLLPTCAGTTPIDQRPPEGGLCCSHRRLGRSQPPQGRVAFGVAPFPRGSTAR